MKCRLPRHERVSHTSILFGGPSAVLHTIHGIFARFTLLRFDLDGVRVVVVLEGSVWWGD